MCHGGASRAAMMAAACCDAVDAHVMTPVVQVDVTHELAASVVAVESNVQFVDGSSGRFSLPPSLGPTRSFSISFRV